MFAFHLYRLGSRRENEHHFQNRHIVLRDCEQYVFDRDQNLMNCTPARV